MPYHGYAGIISKKEKINYENYGDIRYDAATDRYITTATRYNGDSYIGKYGLEQLYEISCSARTDDSPISNQGSGSRGMLYSTAAVDGDDLHLTLSPSCRSAWRT